MAAARFSATSWPIDGTVQDCRHQRMYTNQSDPVVRICMNMHLHEEEAADLKFDKDLFDLLFEDG